MTERCGNCRFWRDHPADHDPEDGRHACTRFPPTVIFKLTGTNGRAIFPGVMATDWCGEWRKKEND